MPGLLLTIVFFVFSLCGWSQQRFGKVKCDSFQVLTDTSRALVHKKNKTAVYDKSDGRYLSRPAKDVVLYIREYDCFLKISPERIALEYIGENKPTLSFYNDDPDYSKMWFGETKEAEDSVLLFNQTYLNYLNGSVLSQDLSFTKITGLEVIRKTNDQIVVNYAQPPTTGFENGETAKIENPGFAKSGVFHLQDRSWMIPPVYEKCHFAGKTAFCLKRNKPVPEMHVAFEPEAGVVYGYDQYQLRDGKWTLKKENIQANHEVDLAALLEVDSVRSCSPNEDSPGDECFVYSGNKQGLVLFKLFDVLNDGTMGRPGFVFQQLLENEHDYILVDPKYELVFTFSKHKEKPFSIYRLTGKDEERRCEAKAGANEKLTLSEGMQGKLIVEVDGEKTYAVNIVKYGWEEAPRIAASPVVHGRHLQQKVKQVGFEKLNDTLLIVHQHMDDYFDFYSEPLKSRVYPDEDSVTYDDKTGLMMVVYPAGIVGYAQSGILNMTRGQWFVDPVFRKIEEYNKGILIENVHRKANGEFDHVDYSLQTLDGMVHIENCCFTDEDEGRIFPWLLGGDQYERYEKFPERTVYGEDDALDPDRSVDFTGHHYYVLSKKGKWQVVKPFTVNNEITNIPRTLPKDWVCYNPAEDYYLWLENDSLYALSDQKQWAVSQNDGVLKMAFQGTGRYAGYKTMMIENGDTTVDQSSKYKSGNNERAITVTVKNNRLVFNENYRFDDLTLLWESAEYGEYFAEENKTYRRFDIETSCVWEKENGVWVKKTPYYASVEMLPFGYLAKIGDMQEMTDDYERMESPGRYVLLDMEYKPMAFMDFYDFMYAGVHDFGVEICTDDGCFFVNDKGKPVTAAEWHDFELSNGKLKAIRYKNLNEDGRWQPEGDAIIEEEQLFDLYQQQE